MTGRLGSIYGHKNILLGGAAWWIVWSFINAFCNNFIAFNIARALSGIGAAMIVPNAIAIIGTTLPPGKMRNLSLGFFGAGAPVGGWLVRTFLAYHTFVQANRERRDIVSGLPCSP